MKLSRTMRTHINLVPDEGEYESIYQSTFEPHVRRGLVVVERRVVMRPRTRWFVRLTDLGRQVRGQNTDG